MHANLPHHLYVNVDNRALGPSMPAGVTAAIWHGIYTRPGQVIACHLLLESGANWSGIPIHCISTTTDFSIGHTLLQPWGAMGREPLVWKSSYLEGLEAVLLKSEVRPQAAGRHTGIVIDWSDGFSIYPQEHKPLNLIHLDSGQFCLLPNNYLLYNDAHFTNTANGATASQNIKHYRRGDVTYWEGDKTTDTQNNSTL